MRRRTFLKLGLLGSSLLGLGGGLFLYPSLRLYAPRRPLLAIQSDRFCVLASVAARVVPLPGADPVELAHRVDAALALAPPESVADINALLGLLDNGLAGLILDGRPQPFTRLSPAAQDATLYAYRDSHLVARRAGCHALRRLCLGAYYAQESTWADVGYPGPPQLLYPSPLPSPGTPG